MAVLGGLNEGPVYRLKHTIAEIPQKLKDVRVTAAVCSFSSISLADFQFLPHTHTAIESPSGFNECRWIIQRISYRACQCDSTMHPIHVRVASCRLVSFTNPSSPHLPHEAHADVHSLCDFVVFSGIYLRDLTYFEEGGSSGDGLINFKKKKNVYSVIQIIQKYQATPYTARKNERAYNYLKAPPRMADEELFRLSLAIEPRNAKRNEIQ
jgi:hypothetical protein